MNVLPLGLRSAAPALPASPSGEILAATPLGRDESGKNLVAYIVRTDDDAPQVGKPANLANNNDRAAAIRQALQQNQQARTPARAVTPDALLTARQQAQAEQLRARSAEVQQDAASGKSQSFIYDEGPDGRRYAVGQATTFLAEQGGAADAPVAGGGKLNPYLVASNAYRQTAGNDAQGQRAGVLDHAI